MNRLATCTAFLVGLAVQSSEVVAADSSVLYPLANRYDAAVQEFEQLVRQVRGIDRNDERLVDRLSDATVKLRLAARNPRHFNRVFYEWKDVQKLHAQVEQRIFGKYTPNHELTFSWDAVNYYYSLFVEEFVYHVENPRHGNSVRRLQSSNARRDRYLGSPTWTPTFTPPQRPSLVPTTPTTAKRSPDN
jgi:hypothetical protein